MKHIADKVQIKRFSISVQSSNATNTVLLFH